MTPRDVARLWEDDWGIRYAGRIKFKAPEGSAHKWLNHGVDFIPAAPAEVRLEGLGSVLSALRLALEREDPEHQAAAGAREVPAGAPGPRPEEVHALGGS
eukprot:CAMPEP_0168459258 /NCGR_PEP_ID=MMETSP0228-20121227/52816_1 /TAXON_ID=133427 /ORGANISM="Protoceratium reticulatum, Strain CCCM 535 (=CCMP 1889)" /LENGTH=99 /DNA_ID=CAMNT_0008474415 /DNA_START=17 /DNA_END=313 /DNA_ORIENTATION=+